GWRLAAGEHQAALMRGFAGGVQKAAVAGHAVAVAALALAWLEQCFVIVEYEQTAALTQQLQKRGDPLRFGVGRHALLVGQEPNGTGEPVSDRWRVAQAAPVDTLE